MRQRMQIHHIKDMLLGYQGQAGVAEELIVVRDGESIIFKTRIETTVLGHSCLGLETTNKSTIK